MKSVEDGALTEANRADDDGVTKADATALRQHTIRAMAAMIHLMDLIITIVKREFFSRLERIIEQRASTSVVLLVDDVVVCGPDVVELLNFVRCWLEVNSTCKFNLNGGAGRLVSSSRQVLSAMARHGARANLHTRTPLPPPQQSPSCLFVIASRPRVRYKLLR
jgi:hypothetical protein